MYEVCDHHACISTYITKSRLYQYSLYINKSRLYQYSLY